MLVLPGNQEDAASRMGGKSSDPEIMQGLGS